MKRVLLGVVFSMALVGCTGKDESPAKGDSGKPPPDLAAGKAFVEKECKGCHGLDGRSIAPGIPHLAGQRERYLIAAIDAYREGKRFHAALKQMAGRMTDADTRNVAAYFASQPAFATAPAKAAQLVSPYEQGKKLAMACVKCHGEDGNSKGPGIPNLAGQQPRYLVDAMREYLHAERKQSPMHPMLRSLSGLEMETLALYFASQTPAGHKAPQGVDPAAGEPLSAVCGGCHGVHGVSVDSATPSLASQDYQYLVDAIKAYRTTRKREKMRVYVSGLSEKEITEIAAFYAVQKSGPAEKGQTIVQDLTDKCARCHTAGADIPGMAVPRINGQDKDYLVMALRAYRDDRRESSMMHKMSLPYSDAIIESISSYYASHAEAAAPSAAK
jgi:cytochrome c553